MKIWIDLDNTPHVPFFKPIIRELEQRGFSVVLTARESLAAVAGVERLQRMGFDVAAVSGIVTNSPLSRREVELGCGVQCVPTSRLGRELTSLTGSSHESDRAERLGSLP